jgi:general secretion pathway protein H
VNPTRSAIRPARRPGGFTLLELMIVVALIAVATAVASLALRDPDTTRLEREGQRLAALFEAARAQSRALGVAALWVPGPAVLPDGSLVGDFHFEGMPASAELPVRWLDAGGGDAVSVELPAQHRGIVLGPEPVIGAQRLVLHLADKRLVLSTDGLGPFTVIDDVPR